MVLSIVGIVFGIVIGSILFLVGVSAFASLRSEYSIFNFVMGIIFSVVGVAIFIGAIINIVKLATGQGG